ncbi:hypothetical protein P43SY_008833 [Pythium insidiosum]|uniref:BED-type domain-containing protein n=1 Tax=Pythium insidiosum TaxID=114742 RepID=A0AAD5LQC4_PYTIN|nr:hypothetical protein P43SY_008833 [Pythium insidiosum]
MPRPASSLWTHFRRDGPNKRAVCKYCQHNMCGLVTRMRAHLARKCPECPLTIKSEMFEADMNRKMDLAMGPAAAAPSHSVAVVGGATSPHNAIKKPRRGRLAGAPSVVLDEKADLDSYVAKAILGAGLPVSTVDNPSFIKLIKRMSPGYELPSAYTLATTSLDLEYTEVQLRLRAEVLDATSVCLGVESWSTSMKRSIISCVINTPNPGVFAFENTGEAPHTPEVLVDKIEHVMTQIGTGKVSVIVMDMRNKNMKQAAMVLEGKYPNITFLPSCSHAMTAMMVDILEIPELTNTIHTCKLIARYFSQNHLARAAFARVSEPMQALEASYPLHDPVDATPVALLECLFGVERNRHSFEILLAENGPLNGLDPNAKEQMIKIR